MNYFLKDVIEIYPLKNYVEFPEMSDYLTAEFITQLEKTNFYNEDKILREYTGMRTFSIVNQLKKPQMISLIYATFLLEPTIMLKKQVMRCRIIGQ